MGVGKIVDGARQQRAVAPGVADHQGEVERFAFELRGQGFEDVARDLRLPGRQDHVGQFGAGFVQAGDMEAVFAHEAYWATQPPSMFQAAPRTWLAAGVQKNTASAPSSSGVTNSPDGCFS